MKKQKRKEKIRPMFQQRRQCWGRPRKSSVLENFLAEVLFTLLTSQKVSMKMKWWATLTNLAEWLVLTWCEAKRQVKELSCILPASYWFFKLGFFEHSCVSCAIFNFHCFLVLLHLFSIHKGFCEAKISFILCCPLDVPTIFPETSSLFIAKSRPFYFIIVLKKRKKILLKK